MIRGSRLARRVGSSRLLLGNVMLAVLIGAALAAALASFAARALPQAVRAQIAGSRAVPISVRGVLPPSQAAADGKAVSAALRSALAGVPYQLDQARWSDLLDLPVPRGSRITPQVLVAAMSRIASRAVLTAGQWPGPPRPGQPVGIALPAAVAGSLHAATGTVLQARDSTTGARLRLRVTGLYRPANLASGYWDMDVLPLSGSSLQPPFDSYGPAVASPAAFGPGGLSAAQASWVALPSAAGLSSGDLPAVASRVGRAARYLQNASSLGGLQVSTGLPALLSGLASNLVVARSLLVIAALVLALVTAAALALAARLLADHREEETALLSARGATRWQLARPTLAEALLLGGIAAVAGVFLGARLAGLLVATVPLGPGGVVSSGPAVSGAAIPAAAWWAAAIVVAFCAAVMIWPAVRPMAPGAVRVRRGRQAALAGVARNGADLALLALAVLAVQELRTYSAVAHPAAGGIGIDPVIALAPVLALAAVALIPLRLLPLAATAAERAAARGRHLAAALASWQISRRPIRQSGPLLLVVLATAAFTLALSQYQTSRQSASDQAAFAVGADLRADLTGPVPLGTAGAVGRAPGVQSAMPVATLPAGNGGELLAVDPRTAPATVLLRGDLSRYPAAALWQRILPPGRPSGVAIPGRPAALSVTARLTPGSASTSPGPVGVTAWIQDASGIVYTVVTSSLPADGRSHRLIVPLSATRQAAYPLRLLALAAGYELPPYAFGVHAPPAQLTIGALAVQPVPGGPVSAPFAGGGALATWAQAASEPGAQFGVPTNAALAISNGSPPTLTGTTSSPAALQIQFHPGYSPSAAFLRQNLLPDAGYQGVLTITAPPPAAAIPGIATSSFLHASDRGVGTILPVTLGSLTVQVKIVAAVRAFPTVTGRPARSWWTRPRSRPSWPARPARRWR